jgi:hypothetical protein
MVTGKSFPDSQSSCGKRRRKKRGKERKENKQINNRDNKKDPGEQLRMCEKVMVPFPFLSGGNQGDPPPTFLFSPLSDRYNPDAGSGEPVG